MLIATRWAAMGRGAACQLSSSTCLAQERLFLGLCFFKVG